MMQSPTNLGGRVSFIATEGQRLRVFQRAYVEGDVILHDGERVYVAPLQNLSAGGLYVEELDAIAPGTQVRIVIKSSRLAAPVQATGTVVRVDNNGKHGSAVEFTSISSRAREIIQNCVFESRMESTLKAL